MQINMKPGQPARLKLTVNERKTLTTALAILEALAPYDPHHTAATELKMVCDNVSDDGIFTPLIEDVAE